MRFREKPVAICGDIREMFHQIRIAKDDQRAQQFLWRGGDMSKKIETYVMTVMTFGASCSPSLANYVRDKNAELFEKDHSYAVHSIKSNTFVDDWLQSEDTEDEMVLLSKTVRKIHRDGGFEMRNWLSNSRRVLEALDGVQNNSSKCIEEHDDKFEKILGMWWLPTSDVLTYFANFSPEVFDGSIWPTKRSILRLVMTIFDPLGIIGNFMIYTKIILQNVWRARTDWDEPVHQPERDKWLLWVNKLKDIPSIKIPRLYK